MRDKLSVICTVTLTVCALALTGMTLRREFSAPAPSQPGERGERVVREWRSYAEVGQRIGPATAAATIVEFADFQCPACAAAAENLRAVRARYPDKVAIVYRHSPIPSHPYAADAAKASVCAAAQGRFEAYHDALFAHQRSIGQISWAAFADSAHVPDAGAFASCMSSGGTVQAVETDQQAARRLGVEATPTLLVNDRLIVGAPGVEELTKMVEQALRTRPSTR